METQTNDATPAKKKFTTFAEICEKYQLRHKEYANNDNAEKRAYYNKLILDIFNGDFDETMMTEEQFEDMTILNSLGIFHETNGRSNLAKRYYVLATEYGCVESHCNLGYFYANVEIDAKRSIHHYTIAYENGHDFAKIALAHFYATNGDFVKSHELLCNMNSTAYKPDIDFLIGKYHEKHTKNEEEMMKHYIQSANADYGDAHFAIGMIYYETKNDYAKFVHHMCEAMRLGKYDAAYCLGVYYETVAINETFMLDCYNVAILGGITHAMHNLALWYGKKLDVENMLYWLNKGADADDALCMFSLGFYYDKTKKDYVKAKQHYENAIKHGNVKAMNSLAFICHQYLANVDNGTPEEDATKRCYLMLAKKYYLMSAKSDDANESRIGMLHLKKITSDAERLYYLFQEMEASSDEVFEEVEYLHEFALDCCEIAEEEKKKTKREMRQIKKAIRRSSTFKC